MKVSLTHLDISTKPIDFTKIEAMSGIEPAVSLYLSFTESKCVTSKLQLAKRVVLARIRFRDKFFSIWAEIMTVFKRKEYIEYNWT